MWGADAVLMMNGDTTVRELLSTHPNVLDVLLGHGMCADCREDPPPVPLSHFAHEHCAGDLPSLLAELNEVIQS